MVDTIEKALRPLSSVAFILGFGILRYPLSYWRFRFSVFYILIVWSLYAGAFHLMVFVFSPRHIFNSHLTFFTININILVTIMSVTITIRKYQKIHICIKKLGLVDNTLEKLGTPKEYRRIKKLIIWILIIYLIVTLTLFATDSIWNIEKHNTIKAIAIPFILGYPFHVNTLGDIMFAFILRYIGNRLDKINNYIEQLSGTEEYGLRFKWKKSLIIRHYVRDSDNRKHVLWTIMHLHSELCRVARNMNDLFGTQLTLQIISYFVILIASFYIQYHMILCLKHTHGSDTAKLKLMLSNDMWCMIFITKFISLNHICESVSAKVEKTKALMHKLTSLLCFTETRKEIYQFLLQISLRPLEFCGMGMFHFGYKFIHKFFIWVLTVIIFILQMDNSSLSQKTMSNRINETCFDRDV